MTEGREEKLTDEGWSDIRLLVKRIWSRAYLDTEEKHIGLIKDHVDKELRGQLSKEREMRKELVEALKTYNYYYQGIPVNKPLIEKLIAKATELDKK